MLTAKDIKYYTSLKQKKVRDNESKFLIEGFHLVEECFSSTYHIEKIFVREDIDYKKHDGVFSAALKEQIPFEKIPANFFKKLADTENSQGIVAVVNKPEESPDADDDIIIALENINDPGNLGTIIRTAYWFGIKSIHISEGSADIYNPKVLRSSQGAVFHTQVTPDLDFKEHLQKLKMKGYNIVLLMPDANEILEKTKTETKAIYVFGNESHGISKELQDNDFKRVKIAGYSDCESLNVAVSAAIVMHHIKNI